MCDPVAEEVEALSAILYVSSDLMRVIWRWVSGEGGGKGGYP